MITDLKNQSCPDCKSQHTLEVTNIDGLRIRCDNCGYVLYDEEQETKNLKRCETCQHWNKHESGSIKRCFLPPSLQKHSGLNFHTLADFGCIQWNRRKKV